MRTSVTVVALLTALSGCSRPATVSSGSEAASPSPSPRVSTSNAVAASPDLELPEGFAEHIPCSTPAIAEDQLVHTDVTISCLGEEPPRKLLRFASQRDRDLYLGLFQVGAVIAGPDWVVAISDKGADDVHRVALGLDGVVVAGTTDVGPTGLQLTFEEIEGEFYRGIEAFEAGRLERSLISLNRVVGAIDPGDTVGGPIRALALLNRGVAYRDLELVDSEAHALRSWSWLIRDHAESRDSGVTYAVVAGLLEAALLPSVSPEEAVAFLDAAVEHGQDHDDLDVSELTARAAWNLASIRELEGSPESARETYRWIVERYEDFAEGVLPLMVSAAKEQLQRLGGS